MRFALILLGLAVLVTIAAGHGSGSGEKSSKGKGKSSKGKGDCIDDGSDRPDPEEFWNEVGNDCAEFGLCDLAKGVEEQTSVLRDGNYMDHDKCYWGEGFDGYVRNSDACMEAMWTACIEATQLSEDTQVILAKSLGRTFGKLYATVTKPNKSGKSKNSRELHLLEDLLRKLED